MTASKMNHNRRLLYETGKAKGYQFISYISSKATVLTDRIGENCFILEDNTIQPFVTIGNNVVLWSGNHIGHHSTIHDHVFFTSHIVLSGHCIVHEHSFFGVNATIRDATEIGEGTLVAMGADPSRRTLGWFGNPAKPWVKQYGCIQVMSIQLPLCNPTCSLTWDTSNYASCR